MRFNPIAGSRLRAVRFSVEAETRKLVLAYAAAERPSELSEIGNLIAADLMREIGAKRAARLVETEQAARAWQLARRLKTSRVA